jgi:predicted Zn-dependent protease
MNHPFRPRLAVLLLSLLCLHAGHAATVTKLPDLGDESAALISPTEERRLGEDFMRQARAQLDLLNDPQVNEYLRKLGARLTAKTDVGHGIYFFTVNNPTVNAFAVPGGFIGVHTGLLLTAQSEAEVAAVLAHETAHLTQRHIPRLLAESQRSSIPTLATVLAGILLAAAGAGQAGAAAIALATAGSVQMQINFTRSYEEEADRIGMQFLDTAGYDVRAMPAFFERMEAIGRLHDIDIPEFLRTHPVTTRRIAESRDHAQQYPAKISRESEDFFHIQARLRVLGSKPEDAVRYFRNVSEQDSHQAANRYGLALALIAAHQLEPARKEVNALLKSNPDSLLYQLLLANLEMEAGNTQTGLQRYSSTLQQFPESLAALQLYGNSLAKAGRYDEAWKILDQAVRKHPEEPALYKLLATAAGESGRKMEAHRAYGEYYYRVGQPREAVEQMELAIKQANGSFYYVSSLEARIREIREESGLLFKNQRAQPPEKGK